MSTKIIDGVECEVQEETSGLNGDRAIYFRPLKKRQETVTIDGVEYALKAHTINYQGDESIYYCPLPKPKKTLVEIAADEMDWSVEFYRKQNSSFCKVLDAIESRLKALEEK